MSVFGVHVLVCQRVSATVCAGVNVSVGTNGYKQVQMGGDGCVWVHRGPGYTDNTETRQTGGMHGPIVHNFEPMVGEISPDMMFWEGRQKMSRMDADGHRSVWIGAAGILTAVIGFLVTFA